MSAGLDSSGWKSPGLWHLQLPAVDEFICDSAGANPRRQDAQRVKPINYRARYHVRIWEFGATESVGSAHAEYVSLTFQHVVMAFESGEQEVAVDLCRARWTVERDRTYQEPLRTSPFDSGRATELRP